MILWGRTHINTHTIDGYKDRSLSISNIERGYMTVNFKFQITNNILV